MTFSLSDAHHLLRVAMRNPKQRTMGAKPVVELDVDVARAVLGAVEEAMPKPQDFSWYSGEVDEELIEFIAARKRALGPRPQGGRS